MSRGLRRRAVAAVALSASVLLGGTACGSADPASGDAAAVQQGDQVRVVDPEAAVGLITSGERVVVDVRTPSEFAEGHVAGALNIDVSAADFEERIKALDPGEGYLVYCQSGNRSAAAAAAMTRLGVHDVVDGAAFGALVAAGAEVRTGD